MSAGWYTRPVLSVKDLPRAVEFYISKLGFKRDWAYDEAGRPVVVQVGREGCELILSAQWPERVGHGLIFISLNVEVLHALRIELEGRGVAVEDGFWGYPMMVVRDPDANTLYFLYPSEAEGAVT